MIRQKLSALLYNSPVGGRQQKIDLDYWLLGACLCLLGLGLVMNASASSAVSAAHNGGNHYYYFIRHVIYVAAGLVAGAACLLVPVQRWQQWSWPLLIVALVLLVLVYVPGIGHEVNGSKRWLNLRVFNLQSSELAKLFMVFFIAGYLVRHQVELERKLFGFVKPLLVLLLFAALIYAEPDFGATTVMVGSVVVMIFLAGTSMKVAAPLLVILGTLGWFFVTAESYRLERITSFTDPFRDQFGSGYQLSQALIAFGRGEIFGVGLGNSVQKQFYLPEAHTDFVFAVLAEELGMVGAILTVLLLTFVCLRALRLGRKAQLAGQAFAAYCAYGIAMMWTGQAFINIGVNAGLLPTKGLTLPFISYGGSSLMVCCVSLAVLVRIEWEMRQALQQVQTPRQSAATEVAHG
ncbi:MAG: putative lipid II flippase FtsW [Gammaproteobacteria bacterium]|jgi:cell division protein FtsW|nr:putative lipid II flippase FtsW [Gammaproteobacteria bacterium]